MELILLNRHEALAVMDGKDTVAVSPACNGTLTVCGSDYKIKHGGKMPDIEPNTNPTVKACFTTERGIRYTILSPRVDKHGFYSRLDPYEQIMKQRLMIDELEKGIEKLTEELLKLRASIRYDALGFIITNETEDEEQ